MDIPRSLTQRFAAQIGALSTRAATSGLVGDRLAWAVLGLAGLVSAILLTLPAVMPGLHAVLWLLPAVLLLRALASAVAEVQAREHPALPAADPALGAVLDAATDLALYLPLAFYPGVAATPVVLLAVLGLLADIAGLAPLLRGAERHRGGPMGTPDRALVFGIAGVILAVDPHTASWLPWLLLPAAGLAIATVVQRLRTVV
jgi:hypothetical protein